MCNSAKEWNHAEKYGPYGELFLFSMEEEPNESEASTPFGLHEFKPSVDQDSVLGHSRARTCSSQRCCASLLVVDRKSFIGWE